MLAHDVFINEAREHIQKSEWLLAEQSLTRAEEELSMYFSEHDIIPDEDDDDQMEIYHLWNRIAFESCQ